MTLTGGLPEIGDLVADKYRVERVLGRGGSGAVYLARHELTGKAVALKWMRPRLDADADDLERFIREARAAARVHHPSIVDIYDVGEHGGSVFLVMEYLHGAPLSRSMQRAPLPAGATIRSLLPAMAGLHAAHRRGVVHRDLKPDNIFLLCGAEGEPLGAKVLDFGISKLQEARDLDDSPSLTETGAVMGTPHYIAPEQAEDAKSVDARADIYALGVILYQAFGGRRPYEASNLPALLIRITRGDAEPLQALRPELPAGLCDAVMRAMAVDPQARFPDIPSLIAALEPFAADAPLPVSTPPPSDPHLAEATTPFAHTPEPPQEPSTIRRGRAGAGLAAGALAMAALALLWLRGSIGPDGDAAPEEITGAAGADRAAAAQQPAPATAGPSALAAPGDAPATVVDAGAPGRDQTPRPEEAAPPRELAADGETPPGAKTDVSEKPKPRRKDAARRAKTRRRPRKKGRPRRSERQPAPAEATAPTPEPASAQEPDTRPGKLGIELDANQF